MYTITYDATILSGKRTYSIKGKSYAAKTNTVEQIASKINFLIQGKIGNDTIQNVQINIG